MFRTTLSLADLLQQYAGLSQLVSETIAFVMILDESGKENISMAYPTQKICYINENGKPT